VAARGPAEEATAAAGLAVLVEAAARPDMAKPVSTGASAALTCAGCARTSWCIRSSNPTCSPLPVREAKNSAFRQAYAASLTTGSGRGLRWALATSRHTVTKHR
jgi:hypothetical protein